jgi:G protein beta subunit-like protein
VNSVALWTERDQIVSGDQSGSVKVWDLTSGKCINDVKPDTFIQSVDVSDDETMLIAASNKSMVYVWDFASATDLKPITKFRAHPVGYYCLHAKISPDSRTLVTTSSDKSAKLWDTATWELKSSLNAHSKWVWDAAFCADSSYLVTASSDHTARLWNLRTSEVVRQYNGHPSAVTCVALNDSSV